MKKQFYRIPAVLLLLALAVGAFAACAPEASTTDAPTAGETEPTSSGTEAAAPETEAPLPELEKKDFGGDEFRILWPSQHPDGHFMHNEISVDTDNGDVIDSAVFRRNARVEEDYHIDIVSQVEWCSDISGLISRGITSGDSEFDAYCAPIAMVTSGVLSGHAADYAATDYYKVTDPWWDHRVMQDFSIAGKKYFGSGDLIYSDNFYPYTVFANTDMFANYHFSDDLFELAETGGWTLDKMMEFCCAVPVSSDEKWDYDDTYGVLVNCNLARAIYYGAGRKLLSFDTEGHTDIAMTPENSQDILEKCLQLFHGNHLAYDTDDDIGHNIPGKTHAQTAIEMFSAGQGLFYAEELIVAERLTAAGFDSPFAVLPVPKYTADQPRYYCVMNDAVVVCIPSNADVARSALVLSAMSRESVKTLTPAFYNIVLTYRYLSDAKSVSMLNIILDSVQAPDIGTVLNWGNIITEFKHCVRDNRTDFASRFKTASRSASTKVKEYNKQVDAIGK